MKVIPIGPFYTSLLQVTHYFALERNATAEGTKNEHDLDGLYKTGQYLVKTITNLKAALPLN